jgi:hypothetical protein
LDGQKAENEFTWPIDPFKHRFIDYKQVAFWADHKKEKEFSVWVHPLKNYSISPKSHFGSAKKQTILSQVVAKPETSLYRLQASRKLSKPQGRKWVLRAFQHLKYRFIDFNTVAFCDIQKADNDFPGPFDHLEHRFLDLVQAAFFG